MKLVIDRLSAANPRWRDWGELITLVKSLTFEEVIDEHLGTFYTSDHPLVFSDPAARNPWPAWLPTYVPALFGMMVDDFGMAGGYADLFCNELAVKGAIFSQAGNDEDLGFPIIDVPPDLYPFQSNSSGAQFFINKHLMILYPNAKGGGFEILDHLEDFTKRNLRQALEGETWFGAYTDLKGALLD
jgi:hypothetical protein